MTARMYAHISTRSV